MKKYLLILAAMFVAFNAYAEEQNKTIKTPKIHRNYPYDLNDNDLKETMQTYSEEIFNKRGNINTVLQISPLLQTGQLELQSRQTTRVSYISLGIALLALGIAIHGARSSSRWQKEQMSKLKQLINEVKNIKKYDNPKSIGNLDIEEKE